MADMLRDVAKQEPDGELIDRVTGGEKEAFELLYERYFPRVYGFLSRRLDNRADVEETVQEVFISVFSSLESFRGEAPFSAWVLGVARRTLASRFKRKRHPTVSLDGPEDPDRVDDMMPMARREPTPHDYYERDERLRQLETAALRTLSAEQRVLFQLHHLEHRSIHEIAHRLAKSEDAVKSNLYRTRRLLLAR